MSTFFQKLNSGDKAVSIDLGLVNILSTEVRDGVKYASCETIPSDSQDNDTLEFEAVEGELSCPIEWQINSAISSCEARIENGADIVDSFTWLKDEVRQAYEGKFTYDFN